MTPLNHLCFCKCGQHSLYTIYKVVQGKPVWFLNGEHLKKWEDSHYTKE